MQKFTRTILKKLSVLVLLSFPILLQAQTLTVSTTSITGLTYVLGNGPSSTTTFTVSGSSLSVGNVYIQCSSGFEISLSSSSGFSNQLTISNADGTLAATNVYVRLAGSRLVGSYTDTLYSYSGSVKANNIIVSGSVTPPALATPTVGTPNNATSKGFTANWSAVTNAVGYLVKVYKSGSLRSTYTVNSQSTNSLQITDLLPSTDFYYTVTATGDNVNYVNSVESAASSSIQTQEMKSFLLYKTDFTDWGAVTTAGSSTSTVINFTGGGNGFYGDNRPLVYPTGVVGNYTGYYTSAAGSGTLSTKPMNYVDGGILEITIYEQGTIQRTISVGGTTDVMFKELSFPSGTNYSNILAGSTTMGSSSGINTANMNTWISGNSIALKGSGGYAKVWFYLPNLTANNSITISGINGTSSPTNVNIVDLKLYSLVNQKPCVYIANKQNNSTLTINSDKNSTVKTDTIQIGGFNITKNVKLSIDGVNANSFTLSDTLISAANILNGKSISIGFKPSSFEGIKTARLKIYNEELSEPIYLNLLGITGTSSKLLTPTDTIEMWTQLAGEATHTILVRGINLAYDATLTLGGANVNSFTISKSTVANANLLVGEGITLKCTGLVSPGVQNATLTIKTIGANTIVIPIKAITLADIPTLYNLSFESNPKGMALIETSPAGTSFAEGAKVTVKVTPETGYTLYSWSDGKSGALTTRTVTVSSIKNGTITANLKPIINDLNPISDSTLLTVYKPTDITTTSFNISWTAVTNATSYTVTIFEGDKVVGSPITVSGTSTSITGLNPGVGYSYSVKANTGKESAKVGPFATLPIIVSGCSKK